jgi:hypothetical protein
MALKGGIELLFVNWVFWYWAGSLWECRIWDSQVAHATEIAWNWSTSCFEMALLSNALLGYSRCLVIAQTIACERHAIHHPGYSL